VPARSRGAARVSRGLRGDPPDDQLAVVVGVPVHRLERFRALEVEVQVVLPGEPDAAVHLDRLAADWARGVADIRLCARRRAPRVSLLLLNLHPPRCSASPYTTLFRSRSLRGHGEPPVSPAAYAASRRTISSRWWSASPYIAAIAFARLQ